jgi:hypothetical protein
VYIGVLRGIGCQLPRFVWCYRLLSLSVVQLLKKGCDGLQLLVDWGSQLLITITRSPTAVDSSKGHLLEPMEAHRAG